MCQAKCLENPKHPNCQKLCAKEPGLPWCNRICRKTQDDPYCCDILPESPLCKAKCTGDPTLPMCRNACDKNPLNPPSWCRIIIDDPCFIGAAGDTPYCLCRGDIGDPSLEICQVCYKDLSPFLLPSWCQEICDDDKYPKPTWCDSKPDSSYCISFPNLPPPPCKGTIVNICEIYPVYRLQMCGGDVNFNQLLMTLMCFMIPSTPQCNTPQMAANKLKIMEFIQQLQMGLSEKLKGGNGKNIILL